MFRKFMELYRPDVAYLYVFQNELRNWAFVVRACLWVYEDVFCTCELDES